MENKIQAALRHVNGVFPQVTQVFFGLEGRWMYCDEDFDVPNFDEALGVVDIDLLQDAADAAESEKGFPCAYRLASCTEAPSTTPIEVSLDGGVTYRPAKEGVRIIYKGIMIDGEDGRGELHINATHEGLITDVWTTREEPLDHNIGTDSVTIDDIVSRLVDDECVEQPQMFEMVMRSKTLSKTDTEKFEVYPGQTPETVAARIAESYGATVESITPI